MTETRISKTGPKGGQCPYCLKEVGGLVVHERYCLQRDWSAEVITRANFIARASAHAAARPRAAQRWQNGVEDLDVAAVLFAIEANSMQPRRTAAGRWVGFSMGRGLSVVVNEMIRTGLVRHVVRPAPQVPQDVLVPALVHLNDGTGTSACRFTGEDMGPMRARLVRDLALVDCLECEAAVARGHSRGL